MKDKIINNGVDNVYRINKKKAEKLYNEGIKIYIIPNNANYIYGSFVDSKTKNKHMGIFWHILDKKYIEKQNEKIIFEDLIKEKLFYTPKEFGTYCKFYVKDLSLI